MANTLTNLTPDAYVALDQVAREQAGYVPSVMRDASADKVAVGQNLRVPQTLPNTAGGDVTPAMVLPSAADQSINNKIITISKSRFFPFSWTGEEQYAMNQGLGYLTYRQYQIAQAFRAAINEIDAALAAAVLSGASRAYGTAGTTPFGTAADMTDLSQTRKILADNGAPVNDNELQLVMNTSSGANLRGKMSNLFKVNEAGDNGVLRNGSLTSLPLEGFSLHESAQTISHVKGTGAGYVLNGAHAKGLTTIAANVGAGTILAGDIVTINSVKYVAATALAAGLFTINEPGLLAAGLNGNAITVENSYAQNSAFHRGAVVLATRLPQVPEEGDLAIERETITDPISGLSFEFAIYPGFKMIVGHVSIAYGVSVIKPEFVTTLEG